MEYGSVHFAEAKALAAVLRDGVMRVFNAAKSNENKGDKMHLALRIFNQFRICGTMEGDTRRIHEYETVHPERKRCHGEIVESKGEAIGKSPAKRRPYPWVD